MPVIKLEYDDNIISERQAAEFSDAIRQMIIKATNRPEIEVCLYGNASQFKLNVAPIQIWLEISDNKVDDADILAEKIRELIVEWKTKTKFEQQIKFTLRPIAQKVIHPV